VTEPTVGLLWVAKRRGDVEFLAATANDRRLGPDLRWWATWFLRKFDDPLAVETLARLLDDPNWSLRRQAARSLEKIGDETAVPALVSALHDVDRHVQIAATCALRAIEDESAIPPLLALVKATDDDLVHNWATGALVELGAPEAADLLLPYLEGRLLPTQGLLRRWNARSGWTRRWAAHGLGKLGRPDALEPLRRARARDRRHWFTYRRAIKAIERREPA
jgi:HEAT repeat protein